MNFKINLNFFWKHENLFLSLKYLFWKTINISIWISFGIATPTILRSRYQFFMLNTVFLHIYLLTTGNKTHF